MVDVSDTLKAKSDQLDNVDLVGGPRVFTVADVVVKNGHEQPLEVYFEEYDRPWKPGVNRRRQVVAAWGKESSAWIGRKIRLYRDESVRYKTEQSGGTRISHMSHIEKPVKLPLKEYGKVQIFTVQPLTEQAPTPPPTVSDEQIASATTVDQLRALWAGADPMQQAAIKTRVAEIEGAGA